MITYSCRPREDSETMVREKRRPTDKEEDEYENKESCDRDDSRVKRARQSDDRTTQGSECEAVDMYTFDSNFINGESTQVRQSYLRLSVLIPNMRAHELCVERGIDSTVEIPDEAAHVKDVDGGAQFQMYVRLTDTKGITTRHPVLRLWAMRWVVRRAGDNKLLWVFELRRGRMDEPVCEWRDSLLYAEDGSHKGRWNSLKKPTSCSLAYSLKRRIVVQRVCPRTSPSAGLRRGHNPTDNTVRVFEAR